MKRKRPARTPSNPFRRKRRPNQQTRYLNKREATEHPSFYDSAGNRRTS